MTKEEYLNTYKEDKLAEMCSQFDEEISMLHEHLRQLSTYVGGLNKKCDQLDVWNNIGRLFDKMKTLPAKDFIKLYYMMQDMMQNKNQFR